MDHDKRLTGDADLSRGDDSATSADALRSHLAEARTLLQQEREQHESARAEWEREYRETLAGHREELKTHQSRRKEAAALIAKQRDQLARQAKEMAILQRAYLRRSPTWWLIAVARWFTGKTAP